MQLGTLWCGIQQLTIDGLIRGQAEPAAAPPVQMLRN